MNELDDNQINQAVAEWMGTDKAEPRYRFTYWSKSSPPILCGGFITMDGAVQERKQLVEQGFCVSDEVWSYQPLPDIPNFTGCLNAVALAEQRLRPEQRWGYGREVREQIRAETGIDSGWPGAISATAKQRCLALLRVVRPSLTGNKD